MDKENSNIFKRIILPALLAASLCVTVYIIHNYQIERASELEKKNSRAQLIYETCFESEASNFQKTIESRANRLNNEYRATQMKLLDEHTREKTAFLRTHPDANFHDTHGNTESDLKTEQLVRHQLMAEIDLKEKFESRLLDLQKETQTANAKAAALCELKKNEYLSSK